MNKSGKNNGFKTPEGYFEGLKDKLMGKLSDEDSVSPNPDSHRGDGFVVPQDYFETLNEKIKAKVDKKEAKVVQLNPYRKYYFAAASIAAVALVIFGLNWNTSDETTFADLANSDIETYFENNELGLSSYEIAEVIPVDELEINDILENQLDEDNVFEYLNDNIDDFEELNLDNDE
ncbi:MAG: hypothetical protein ACR2MT_09755 [Aurantibacter sp.]